MGLLQEAPRSNLTKKALLQTGGIIACGASLVGSVELAAYAMQSPTPIVRSVTTYEPLARENISQPNSSKFSVENNGNKFQFEVPKEKSAQTLPNNSGSVEAGQTPECKIPMIEVSADEYEAHIAKGEYGLKTSIRNSTNNNGVITYDEPIVSYFVDDPSGTTCENMPTDPLTPITP